MTDSSPRSCSAVLPPAARGGVSPGQLISTLPRPQLTNTLPKWTDLPPRIYLGAEEALGVAKEELAS